MTTPELVLGAVIAVWAILLASSIYAKRFNTVIDLVELKQGNHGDWRWFGFASGSREIRCSCFPKRFNDLEAATRDAEAVFPYAEIGRIAYKPYAKVGK